jgi:hypothetical protein
MWLLLELKVSRNRGQTSGRHVMRYYQWCKAHDVDPTHLLVVNALDGYYAWMAERPYSERTIRGSELAFVRLRAFLTETPPELWTPVEGS